MKPCHQLLPRFPQAFWIPKPTPTCKHEIQPIHSRNRTYLSISTNINKPSPRTGTSKRKLSPTNPSRPLNQSHFVCKFRFSRNAIKLSQKKRKVNKKQKRKHIMHMLKLTMFEVLSNTQKGGIFPACHRSGQRILECLGTYPGELPQHAMFPRLRYFVQRNA